MVKAESFKSPKLPAPIGPYSQAIKFSAGSMIYVAGMTSLNGDNELVGEGDVKAQTKRILTNVSTILEDAGTSLNNVIKVTVILKDRSLFADFNEAYGEFFKDNQPARTPIFSDIGPNLISMDFIAGME